MWIVKVIFCIYICTTMCMCKIYNLHITNDTNKYIYLSSFGFYAGGKLTAKLTNFRTIPEHSTAPFGFSLVKTEEDRIDFYLKEYQSQCVLEDKIKSLVDDTVIFFKLDLANKMLTAKCQEPSHIYKNYFELQKKWGIPTFCTNFNFAIDSTHKNNHTYYNSSFAMAVDNTREEGLYYLFFHSCPNYSSDKKTLVDFTIEIVEQNPNSYLSTNNIPLPAVYCITSVLFFLSGMFWVLSLRRSRCSVHKIHNLMSYLVFLVAISLASRGIDYHYVDRLGMHLVSWNVLFHVTSILMKLLLVTVLVLLGTGWNIIKERLTARDKWILGLILLLEVPTSLIGIFLEETGDAPLAYPWWRILYQLFDNICWIGILFTTICTIRYLKNILKVNYEVTDNLRQYRFFYILLVFYFYFTKVVAYLIKINLPFDYLWLQKIYWILITYVFFVFTGCLFRPSSLLGVTSDKYIVS